MGENPDGDNLWWVLTPDMDCYPESLNVPPLLGLAACGVDGIALREGMLGRASYWGQEYAFGQLPSPAVFFDTLSHCKAQEVVEAPGEASEAEPIADERAPPLPPLPPPADEPPGAAAAAPLPLMDGGPPGLAPPEPDR
eukprot:188802-Lingulodinium_polyedra.AAC.2